MNVNQKIFSPVWEPFLHSAFYEEEIPFRPIWQLHRQLRGNNMYQKLKPNAKVDIGSKHQVKLVIEIKSTRKTWMYSL